MREVHCVIAIRSLADRALSGALLAHPRKPWSQLLGGEHSSGSHACTVATTSATMKHPLAMNAGVLPISDVFIFEYPSLDRSMRSCRASLRFYGPSTAGPGSGVDSVPAGAPLIGASMFSGTPSSKSTDRGLGPSHNTLIQ